MELKFISRIEVIKINFTDVQVFLDINKKAEYAIVNINTKYGNFKYTWYNVDFFVFIQNISPEYFANKLCKNSILVVDVDGTIEALIDRIITEAGVFYRDGYNKIIPHIKELKKFNNSEDLINNILDLKNIYHDLYSPDDDFYSTLVEVIDEPWHLIEHKVSPQHNLIKELHPKLVEALKIK